MSLKTYIENNWTAENEISRNLKNEPRCGLKCFYYEKELPVLEFYNTDYKYFIGTNRKFMDPSFSKFLDHK